MPRWRLRRWRAQPKRTTRRAPRLLDSLALPRNLNVTLSRPLDARSRRVDLKARALRYLQELVSLARRVMTVRFRRLTLITTLPPQTCAGRRERRAHADREEETAPYGVAEREGAVAPGSDSGGERARSRFGGLDSLVVPGRRADGVARE